MKRPWSLLLAMMLLAVPEPASAQSPNCPAAIPNDGNTDHAAINTCLSNGDTILEAGVYWIGSSLILDINNTALIGAGGTDGTGASGTVLAAINGMWGPMLIAEADGFDVLDIYFDGRVANRSLQYTCDGAYNGGYRDFGYNIQIKGDAFDVHDITSTGAMCGTGMEVMGAGYTIRNSTFFANGIPEDGSYSGDLPWADGLTLLLCDGGDVYENSFFDNTDINVVVGGNDGGSGCEIEDNLIASWTKHAFAGLHVGFYNEGGGDHEGSSYSDNQVIGYSNKMAFGIIVGFHPWDDGIDVVHAGTVAGNTIYGGVIGLAIDGIDAGVVSGNSMSNQSGTYGFGCSVSDDYTAYDYGGATIQGGSTARWFHNASCGT